MDKAKIIEISHELFPVSKPRNYFIEGQRMGFEKGYEFMLVNEPIEWLQNNKKFISIRAIEQELKMPESTLTKELNGTQKMAEKWHKPLNKFLNNLIKL